MSCTRGTLLAGIALALLGLSLAAEAQNPTMRHRIAYLSSDIACGSPQVALRWVLEGLHAHGYFEGQHIAIECRSAEGKYERLDALAVELVRIKPAVIIASAAPASLAVKRATATIPIVSVNTADPVGFGLVVSLRQPGGNITGISSLHAGFVAKSLQLLKEAAPRILRVGVLGDGRIPTFEIYKRELEPAHRSREAG